MTVRKEEVGPSTKDGSKIHNKRAALSSNLALRSLRSAQCGSIKEARRVA